MEDLILKEYNGHQIAVAFHKTDSKNIVIFCHGFRGANIGPSRFFVWTARELAQQGISSLRFDQYGSGNSEGDFYDSSFNDWVETTQSIANEYLESGYRVALLGQSMGAAAVISVGASTPGIDSLVAWAPDPNIDEFKPSEDGFFEEGGQRVQNSFWQEAHDARVAEKLKQLKAAAYIAQCTADEYVDEQNRQAITDSAQSNHKVEDFEGYPHSAWTYDQAKKIIDKSVSSIVGSFK